MPGGMTVVLDTSVIASAIFWHSSTARRCLTGLARRKFKLAATHYIATEYALTCATLRRRRPQQDPSGPLAWILSRAWYVEPAPLGRQRSRDPKDDPMLACALAARADYLVTGDRDLLVLGKPFGVAIVTPAEFLRILADTSS
jgi:putative PIN family toxin of toxin-antitoxin system